MGAAATSAAAAAISDPLRIGLVGCGRIAELGYAPAFERAQAVTLVAVADRHADRCRAVAPEVAAYGSVRELAAASDAEAIVVATPVGMHVAVAADASAAGLPALVEKPPAPSADDARRFLELEPAPMIAFNRRFDGALRELRDRIAPTGTLDLQLVFHRRGTWGSYSGDDPLLLDTGPHALDLVRWLSGAEILRLRATESDHGASVDAELADGRGTARIELRTNRPYREVVRAAVDGTVVGRHAVGGVVSGVLARLGRTTESPLVPSLAQQLDAFAAAVRGHAGHGVGTAADGLAIMHAVDAARTSARSGGAWQSIPTPRECSRSFSSTR